MDPSVAHILDAPVTVGASLCIAVMASFVALEYAGRLHVARDRTVAMLWILAGSIALGSGIWAMHFVGMSAASYPFVATYGEALTAGSWVAAVAVSAVLLGAMAQASLSHAMLVTIAVGGGLGATGMHFIGQNALVVFPLPGYHAGWIVLAVVTAAIGAGPSVTGECSIKGVADGTVMKQTIKGVEEESCLLYFLPGSFAEIGLGAKDYFDCAMLDYGLRGHLTSIREPGKIGLSVPKITVCFASYPGTSAPTKRS